MNTYEKKYKETLERAKTLYENANGMILKKWVEQVFPELAESEDEKIRQKFIKLVKMSSEVGGFALHKWEADEMLAWLEKQGKHKDYYTKKELIAMGFSFTLNGDIVTPDEMMEDMKKYLAWKEKQGNKPKKVEDEEYNSEDYGIDGLWHAKNILEKTLGEVDGYQTDDGILSHKCAITAVKKLYEKKSEWSEEDESISNDIKLAISSYWYEDTENNILEWLKSLKDRVQPQSQPVWSEEDEDNLNLVIYHIRCDDIPYSPHDVEPIVDWLNSIKQRLVGDDYERK